MEKINTEKPSQQEAYKLSYMHRKQVARMLGMAMADDNSIGKPEFDEVCHIVLEQWDDKENVPSIDEVKVLVKEQQQALMHTSTRQSIFMNVDVLTDEDITKEVRNLMRIIVIDNSITDREREAFIIYCRIMRVCNTSQLWRELSKMTLDELRNPEIATPEIKFHKKSSRMSISDFEVIFEAFSFYKIHSPILDGAYHILQREKTRNSGYIVRQNKRLNHLTFFVFAICAATIYALISVPYIHNHITVNHHEWCGSIISLSIMCMMLSIEWLIFSRSHSHGTPIIESKSDSSNIEAAENKSPHKQKLHTSLALFVGIAILLDICLGIIEIPNTEIGIYSISITVLSAIFLGCICFFTGKFFENIREHQIMDIGKMGEITSRLQDLSLK